MLVRLARDTHSSLFCRFVGDEEKTFYDVDRQIIGLVVAEIKDALKLPKEDSAILAPTFRKGTKIGYILSLGKAALV